MIRNTIFGLLTLLLMGPINQAHAEIGSFMELAPSLTKQDIKLAEKAARVEMEGKAPGTVLGWNNPKSGNSGTVRLIRNRTWKDNNCRQLVHEFHIKDKEKQRWEFLVCLMKDNTWKWPESPKRLP